MATDEPFTQKIQLANLYRRAVIWFALLLLVVGVPGALFPYRLSLFSERLDAIGSKTRMTEVEPADWKVLVTRIFGVGFSLVGLFLAFLWVAPRL